MEHDRRVDTMVAGGRYELYSNYALKIQAVGASVTTKQGRAGGNRDGRWLRLERPAKVQASGFKSRLWLKSGRVLGEIGILHIYERSQP
jgi:hypothetical protein